MRWSLIVSLSAAIFGLVTLSAYGLVIPSKDTDLVSRAVVKRKSVHRPKNPLSQGSKKDRAASKNHGHKYDVQKDKNGMKKWQADHIFEKQMVHGHLKENGLKFQNLPKKTQKQVNKAVNGPHNLARIPGKVNGSKGSKVRNTMKGNKVTPRKDRDHYMKQSYPQAQKVAKQIDKAYKQGNVKLPKSTAEQFLHKTMKKGGVPKPKK